MASVSVPTTRLATGAVMPLVGLGTWKAPAGEVSAAVLHALKSGYRHLGAFSMLCVGVPLLWTAAHSYLLCVCVTDCAADYDVSGGNLRL